MSRIYMVRHGRAAAGWNENPDPGLDELGRSQALAVASHLSSKGPLPVMSSPLLRCQQTAFPLATAWSQSVAIEPMVGEIPSPEGYTLENRVEWLRDAMATTWSAVAEKSGAHYAEYHANIAKTVASISTDTVIFSHFIAINAVIGAATNDDRVLIHHLANCSVSVFDTDGNGGLALVEVGGEDLGTLIRQVPWAHGQQIRFVLSLLLVDIHKSWAWVAILSNALAGLWALAAHKVTPLRTRALWWFTGAAEFSIFIQVALGVALVNKGHVFKQFHAFYGFVAIMAIAIVYSYRHQLKSRVYLLYGFGGLFFMGLGIRAMLVGQ